jgi:hypothetical protein
VQSGSFTAAYVLATSTTTLTGTAIDTLHPGTHLCKARSAHLDILGQETGVRNGRTCSTAITTTTSTATFVITVVISTATTTLIASTAATAAVAAAWSATLPDPAIEKMKQTTTTYPLKRIWLEGLTIQMYKTY